MSFKQMTSPTLTTFPIKHPVATATFAIFATFSTFRPSATVAIAEIAATIVRRGRLGRHFGLVWL
jgi:hypothetical protein